MSIINRRNKYFYREKTSCKSTTSRGGYAEPVAKKAKGLFVTIIGPPLKGRTSRNVSSHMVEGKKN